MAFSLYFFLLFVLNYNHRHSVVYNNVSVNIKHYLVDIAAICLPVTVKSCVLVEVHTASHELASDLTFKLTSKILALVLARVEVLHISVGNTHLVNPILMSHGAKALVPHPSRIQQRTLY